WRLAVRGRVPASRVPPPTPLSRQSRGSPRIEPGHCVGLSCRRDWEKVPPASRDGKPRGREATDRSNFAGARRMVFDPGAKRAASPALWCAAAALAALIGLGATARAQDDIDNETPIVAAPVPDAPPSV